VISISYCSPALLTGIASGQMTRLQAAQNAAARLVSFKTAVLVWKCIHGVAPVYLQELCTQVDNIRGRPRIRSASTGCIKLPYERKRLLHNGALLTMDLLCGTVCQQHYQTVKRVTTHIQAASENVLICSMVNTVRCCCGVFASLAPVYDESGPTHSLTDDGLRLDIH